MSTLVEVVGITARDALLATVTASQVTLVGGGQTHQSSSYYTGGPIGAFGGTLFPNADVVSASFGPFPLWTQLTSSAAGAVTSSATGALNPSSQSFEVGWDNPFPQPNGNEVAVFIVGAAKSGSAKSMDSSSVSMSISLKNAGLPVVSRTFGLLPAWSSPYTQYTFRLTDAEVKALSWQDFTAQVDLETRVHSASLSIETQIGYMKLVVSRPGIIQAPPVDNTLWRIVYT